MKKFFTLVSISIIGIFFFSCGEVQKRIKTCEGDSLEILSFNIRYGTANDGPNHWTLRKPILLEFWDSTSADIIGVQEALHFQITEICDRFPAYDFIGVGREDGDTLGEYSAILYKKAVVKVVDSGTFWLSDHPDSVASVDWGNACTRICTWTVFEVKKTPKRFAFYNLHLDHISQLSREKSTELLKKKLSGVADDFPLVITGDFNAGEQNKAILNLLKHDPADSGQRQLYDSFRLKYPDAVQVNTFHGFSGERTGEKIDYIFTDKSIKVLAAGIRYFNREGRYPSDHFPVYAKICF